MAHARRRGGPRGERWPRSYSVALAREHRLGRAAIHISRERRNAAVFSSAAVRAQLLLLHVLSEAESDLLATYGGAPPIG